MTQLIEFLSQQWLLVGALLACVVLLIQHESRRSGQSLTPQQLIDKINHENAVVIDIRDKAAFAKGHIVAALNIPYSQLTKRYVELETHRNQPLIVMCKMGQHAGTSVKLLNAKGFADVSRLGGGIAEWQRSQLPLVK